MPGDSSIKTYYDILTSFEGGVNAGVTPLLLQKNQLAFALNATLRGGNVSCRPPIEVQSLDFTNGGDEVDTDLYNAVVKGKFQGAGVYRPDFGPTQLIAQISGRLFAFTPSASDWVVTEITIAGDPNAADGQQAWMWQSEKWLIIEDGTGALPIFYDGVSCRRSYGPSVVLATVTAAVPANPPGINETVLVTLTAPYTGPYNVPVIFNGAYYQPVNLSDATYAMKLRKIFDTSVPQVGSAIYSRPPFIGPVCAYNVNPTWAADNGWTFTAFANAVSTYTYPPIGIPNGVGYETISNFQIPMDVDARVNVGDQITFSQKVWQVTVIKNATTVTLRRQLTQAEITANPQVVSTSYQVGTPALVTSNNSPSVLIGIVQGVISLSGDEYTVAIDRAYGGNVDAPLWIEATNGFYIGNPAPVTPPVGNDLTLINLSDTSGGAYTFPSEILSVPELPAGRMGAYGMSRNWVCLVDGISYVAGDIVGGASGTPANDYRDSVLKLTENDFLAAGGSFRLPGSGNIINSMTFTVTLDTSQGQGPLQIGTDTGMFSNNTPVDRATWAALENPLQTQSLIGYGPLGQDNTISVNSDIMFRSQDGLGSLVIARRQFGEWGNVPLSREMDPLLSADDPKLLSFGSASYFDNRFLITVSPFPDTGGIIHRGVISLNFDTVSAIGRKSAPVYEGLWTGANVLKFLTGYFDGTQRSLAFTYNASSQAIQLHEFRRSNIGKLFDNGTDRIKWIIETPILFGPTVKPMSELVRLLDAELFVQNVAGQVDIKVEYRPDFYPGWEEWRTMYICADITQANSKYGYRTRLSLGDPTSDACDAANGNRLLRVGHFFQFRITVTGYCKLMYFRAQTTTEPAPDFGPPECSPVCATGELEMP